MTTEYTLLRGSVRGGLTAPCIKSAPVSYQMSRKVRGLPGSDSSRTVNEYHSRLPSRVITQSE